MTDLEKQEIISLRDEGYGYKKIAYLLSISENTVKSFLRRVPKSYVCKNCNKKLETLKKHKPKTFCCNNCRIAFWRKNK